MSFQTHFHKCSPCRYGMNCNRVDCTGAHPNPRAFGALPLTHSVKMCHFASCNRLDCTFGHRSPALFRQPQSQPQNPSFDENEFERTIFELFVEYCDTNPFDASTEDLISMFIEDKIPSADFPAGANINEDRVYIRQLLTEKFTDEWM